LISSFANTIPAALIVIAFNAASGDAIAFKIAVVPTRLAPNPRFAKSARSCTFVAFTKSTSQTALILVKPALIMLLGLDARIGEVSQLCVAATSIS
jgi:hypothetical protein